MRIMLATLCLNETEWLQLLYEQHKNWPGLVNWTFVESADITYARTSPDMVSKEGLSVDGTSEFLQSLSVRDNRISYVPTGFCESGDPAQAKCIARQHYLDIANQVRPDIIVVLDADEFYTYRDQKAIVDLTKAFKGEFYKAFLFRQRHIWKPPSLSAQPLSFRHEVVNGYWSVPHCRVWRWEPDVRYSRNHNYIESKSGMFLNKRLFRADTLFRHQILTRMGSLVIPQCIHMGFASKGENRKAKHEYYKARGEGVTDRRSMYVECRSAYETWKVGDNLPHGAKVIPYNGPIPECFKGSTNNVRSTSSDKLFPPTPDATGDTGVEGAVTETIPNSGGG